jgi:protein CpxP
MTSIIKRLALGLVATGAIVAGVAGVYATAQDQNTNQPARPFMGRGGPGGPMGGPMGFLPRLGRAIQLTDAQRDQIKAIADTHRDEWKSLGDRARAAHDALNTAVTAEAVDETLIRQKSAEVAAVEADIAVARAHVHNEVWQILTSDQKAKLNELRTQAKSRMRNRG